MRWVLSREKSAGRLVFLAALIVVLSLLMVAARPAAAQTGAGVNHVVQPGEYLAKIARNYGTTVHAIMAVNPQITNMNRIYPGQIIFVPIGWTPPPVPIPVPPPTTPPPTVPPGPTCRAWHYVTPGQTLLQISRWYGVDPFAIARANNIWNLNLIFWGTNLCIP